MRMMRLRLALKVFACAGRSRDGRPTTSLLLEKSGLSSRVLSKTYNPGPEALARLTSAAADLLELDEERLRSWLEGAADRELQRQLELEGRKMRCNGQPLDGDEHTPSAGGLPNGWFDPKVDDQRIIKRKRLCLACSRGAATPKTRSWEQEMAEKVQAASIPSALRRAVAKVIASGRALTYRAIAQEAKQPVPQIRRTLNRAGLPEKPRANRDEGFRRYIVWLLMLGGVAPAPTAHTKDFADNISYVN